MSSKKQRETFDVVQWDGMKETALAFFGMPVLEQRMGERSFFFEEADNVLWEYFPDGALIVPLDWYLVKDSKGRIRTICQDSFNSQFEILDEYKA